MAKKRDARPRTVATLRRIMKNQRTIHGLRNRCAYASAPSGTQDILLLVVAPTDNTAKIARRGRPRNT